MSERKRGGGIRLTARGAMTSVLASTLVGGVLQALFVLPALAGVAFVAGCTAAVSLVNRRDLLSLVVSPPLIFLVATLIVEVVRALGTASPIQAFSLGMLTVLSAGAPWLFGGSIVVLLVAWRRGLAQCVRDLREELRAAGPDIPRPRSGSDYAPEPEGYFEPKVYGTPREGQ
ncbi:hypothetical protein FHR32_001808 [Streptosporangium album]|uniref:DUF6542 domain-containing protein n=1 Tax=Streptosporangium album TaxID=47479 RepID=A0A7W7RSQ0_9ACTN|nr:DUF6542 domain-containing protein [Streptosporangium album]MBB4937503.1 hypothetical protein [Streptosporangium album]